MAQQKSKQKEASSQRLGTIGERFFAFMCSKASITCNRSGDEDSDGWDYFLGMDQDLASDPARGRKSSNLQCLVQIKASLIRSNNIKIKLSAAERLAKSVMPAFIVAPKINGNNDVVDCFIQHVDKSIISNVLEQLHKTKAIEVNHTYVHLSLREMSVSIYEKPDLLKSAIENACGPDAFAYGVWKGACISNAGYNGRKYTGSFEVQPEKESDITDFFLGKHSVNASQFSVNEIRWGVASPVDLGGDIATVKIVQEGKKSELCVKAIEGGRTVRFDADAYFAPKVGSEPPKLRAVTHTLEFVFSSTISTITATEDKSKFISTQERLKQAEAYEIFGTSDVDFSLRLKGHNPAKIIMERNDEINLAAVRQNIYLFQKILYLARYLGKQDFHVSEEQLNEEGVTFEHLAQRVETGESFGIVPFEVKDSALVRANVDIENDVLLIKRIKIGEDTVADYSVGTFKISREEDKYIFSAYNLQLRQIELIGSGDEDYLEFQRKAKSNSGIQCAIIMKSNIRQEA